MICKSRLYSGVLSAVVLFGTVVFAAANTDKDALPGAVAKQLGCDCIPADQFVAIYKAEHPEKLDEHGVKSISIAANDKVGYIFKMELMKDAPADPNKYEVMMYIDVDDNTSTGRHEKQHNGVDIVAKYEWAKPMYMFYPKEAPQGARKLVSGEPKIVVDKNTVYFALNIKLKREGNTATFTYKFINRHAFRSPETWQTIVPSNNQTEVTATFPNTTSPELKK